MARILVVDDDPATREVLVEVLSSHGHAVAEAETFLEATQLLDAQIIEVAVVDGQFPKNLTSRCVGDYGPVLCQQARAMGAHTVLLSGHDELVAHERRAGFPALLKPFNLGDLLAAVEAPVGAVA